MIDETVDSDNSQQPKESHFSEGKKKAHEAAQLPPPPLKKTKKSKQKITKKK